MRIPSTAKRIGGLIRTNGKILLLLNQAPCKGEEHFRLYVAVDGAARMPVICKRLSSAIRGGNTVLAIPFMDGKELVVGAEQDGVCEAFPLQENVLPKIHLDSVKWQSRFNRFIARSDTRAMDDLEKYVADACDLGLLWCAEDGDDLVWRLVFRENPKCANTRFRIAFPDGTMGEPKMVLLEQQCIPSCTHRGDRRETRYSLRLPAARGSFIIQVLNTEGSVVDAAGTNAATTQEMIEEYRRRTITAHDYRRYKAWRRNNRVRASRGNAEDFAYQPLISIVVPAYRPRLDFLQHMLESVEAQTYRRWELIVVDSECALSGVAEVLENHPDKRIKHIPLSENKGIVGNTNCGIRAATGEYVAFLDYDDEIDSTALHEYVASINENPDAGAFYCDEDSFEHEGGYELPTFKTAFNRDLLYVHNYITHWLMVRRDVLFEVGLSDDEVNGAQDYDIALKVSETAHPIVHVPKVLYHWRRHVGSTSGDNLKSKPYAHTAGAIALARHFERRGIAVSIHDGTGPFTYKVEYELPNPEPLVEIIIPNKDHRDVLGRCVTSLLEKSDYRNFHITIVENNSTEDETFLYYDHLMSKHGSQVDVILWPHEFNYSKIINYGMQNTTADYVLLLNNDTEVISASFLKSMLGYLRRPEVGVVGAKLLFPDGLVQHAGICLGGDRVALHMNAAVPASWPGYQHSAMRSRNHLAVTGACQMVKRAAFEEVCGYSEEFAVGFNDVDFCCKMARSGYLTVFAPEALLYHYEFTSRGREEADVEKMRRWTAERDLMRKRWPQYLDGGDPYLNPNLLSDNLYYALPDSLIARIEEVAVHALSGAKKPRGRIRHEV